MPDSINNGHKESHDQRTLNDVEMLTDEKWQAIINNDAAYNNQFFYAVKSTGYFANHPVNLAFRKRKCMHFSKRRTSSPRKFSPLQTL